MDTKRKHEDVPSSSPTSKKINTGTESALLVASLNDIHLKESAKKYVYQSWTKQSEAVDVQEANATDRPRCFPIEVFLQPYKLSVMKHFLENAHFLQELKNELLTLELMPKCNDLYRYHQSTDLSNINLPAIAAFRQMMCGQCKYWMEEVTGKKLNDKMTMNCSSYNYTDHLLCHDDQTEDRLIAFVFYLNSEKWNESDGGFLQMFDSDEHKQPKDICRSILPEFNSFVFFEVTNKSFHQVSEVLTADRTRLSINGWYHGVPNSGPVAYYEPELPRFSAILSPQLVEEHIMNKLFLAPDVQSSIANQFEEMNEILLAPFINNELYLKVLSEFKQETICWKYRGPANRRRYEVADIDSLPDTTRKLVNFLKSEVMFTLLQKYTNLDLGSSIANSGGSNSSNLPTCSIEIQRWGAGCYTLLHDDDRSLSQKILDANLFFEAVEEYQGGFISYIARDDDDELLTVSPSANGLALTYRDEETLRFVKYVNSRLGSAVFHTISLTYQE